MPKTYFSMEVNTAAESWRTIRTFRADPPESVREALDADRALEFQMALEQAQQQFKAAASIGYESRPLNLYYGIAQAGRALAAASPMLGALTMPDVAQTWSASGHGLKFSPAVIPAAALFDAKVRTNLTNKDLFSRVSLAVGSPLDFNQVALGELVSQLPEFRMEFGTVEDWLPELHDYGIPSYAVVPNGKQVWDIRLIDAFGDRPSADELRHLLDRYPSLRGLEFDIDETGAPALVSGDTRAVRLMIRSLDAFALDPSGAWWRPRQTTIYRRHGVQLPAVGEGGGALRPLMNWWILLYALSMIARYAPRTWSSILAISTSPIASHVEHLLDTALDAVPDLVAEELHRLQRPGSISQSS